jgi:hypothetical protein
VLPSLARRATSLTYHSRFACQIGDRGFQAARHDDVSYSRGGFYPKLRRQNLKEMNCSGC